MDLHADTLTSDKYIEILAQRQESDRLDINGKLEICPFNSFIITDNGNGFTDVNYESFKTADSSLKWGKGCKGIGRFLWLKAFDKVEINSVYYNKEWLERNFTFDMNGILPDNNVCLSNNNKQKTSISLIGYKRNYREKCPLSLETLAKKIIEHCLVYFLFDNCPLIIIRDNNGEKYF